ncbi:GPI anchored cell wall protein [Rutstroemia sp. NJR-2017a BBW]|nr:GPI anchored cell wall protein [Rutstroemia sp. NJR-2017a BBW]
MKFSTLVFAVGASAATIRRDQCSFTITASGGQSGVVGQLSDGQNRIGGGHPTGTYTISNGQITDAAGRGCILTPSVEQFQCDSGATPTSGFSISSSGQVLYSGSSTFYACAASDSEYNIYTTPVSGQKKCYEVELSASGCYSSSHESSVAPSSVALAPTIYKTTTQEETTTQQQTQKETTVYITQTTEQTAAPPTITVTQTQEQSAPAQTVYITQTQEQSSPAQTMYITQTQEQSATIQTVYITQTNEQTAAPSTVTITQTQEQSASAQTVYITQTNEQTAAPPTITVTQTQEQSASAQTVTQTQTPTYTQLGQSTTLVQALSTTISQATSSPTSSTPSHSSSSCPTNLNGEYQYPHLIVPVSSASPSTAYGTSYNGVVNSTVSSIFNFDIPSSYTGTCSLVFLFPTQDQLETSSYTFSGNGDVDFAQLSTIATQSTTYGSVGSVENDFGTFTVTPGSSTVISTFACPAGETVSYELSEGASGTTDLWFFQDYNPSPLGLYITTC